MVWATREAAVLFHLSQMFYIKIFLLFYILLLWNFNLVREQNRWLPRAIAPAAPPGAGGTNTQVEKHSCCRLCSHQGYSGSGSSHKERSRADFLTLPVKPSSDHKSLWKILKQMGIPDHLTCLLRNLYAGQEATVRTRYGTMDWFQIGKGVCQGCILSPCLFNLYAEHIMRNAGLDEAQDGIKVVGRKK